MYVYVKLGCDEIQNELCPAMVTIYGRKDQLRCNAAATALGRERKESTLKFIEFKADDAWDRWTAAKKSLSETSVETGRR